MTKVRALLMMVRVLLINNAFFTIKAADQEKKADQALLNRNLMQLIEQQDTPSEEECYQAIKQMVKMRYADDLQEGGAHILEYCELRELENKTFLSQKEQLRMTELRVKQQGPYCPQASLNFEQLYVQQSKKLSQKKMKETAQKVHELLEKGADPNTKDWSGDAPLHIAAADDHKIKITKLLLQYGAKINAVDGTGKRQDNGWTPLHRAVIYRQIKSARLLIEKKADVTKRDKCGQTPLQLAQEQMQPKKEIIIPLLAAVHAVGQACSTQSAFSRRMDIPEAKHNVRKLSRAQKIIEPLTLEEQHIGSLKYSRIMFAGVVSISGSAQIIKK